MKKLGIIFLFAIVSITVAHAQVGSLVIKIEGCRSANGKIMIAVGDFSNPKLMKLRTLDASQSLMSVQIDSINTGKHNLYLFHDENENNKLDLSEKGLPAEGYGILKGERISGYNPLFCEIEGGKVNVINLEMKYLLKK